MATRPEPPHSGVFTRDPVRITWVGYGFVQAVTTVLLATDAVSAQVGAIITGVSLAIYVAVSELFVRPDTVPRVPLENLARQNRAAVRAEMKERVEPPATTIRPSAEVVAESIVERDKPA